MSAKTDLRAARQALAEDARAEEAAGVDCETSEFLRLNDAVIAAESRVRWWRDDWREIRDRFRNRRADREDYELLGLR